MYWPASWTIGSELPGNRGEQMGRLNAITNVGQIAGTASAGFLIAWFGFGPAFVTLGVMGALSFALGLGGSDGDCTIACPAGRGSSILSPNLPGRTYLFRLLAGKIPAQF